MQDTVFIKHLEVFTLIGVYDFEREKPQRVLLDLEISADLRQAGDSDALEHTIDYGAIVDRIETLAAENRAKLLEYFGQRICTVLLAEFSIEQLTLRMSKPDIIANASDVGIVLRRQRQR